MKKLGIVVGIVCAMVGGAMGADLCSCHGVLTSHPVIVGNSIRIESATVTVRTTTQETVYTLSAGGNLSLPAETEATLVSVTLKIIATDPDSDVCEAGNGDINARVVANLKVGNLALTSDGNGAWVAKLQTKAGNNNFDVSGTVVDKADQHPDSNDADLTLKNEYKFSIKVNKK